MGVSYPTPLNPWFIMFKVHKGEMVYWSSTYEDKNPWVVNPREASIFMNLSGAARLARTEKADILVLHDKGQLPWYGRDLN